MPKIAFFQLKAKPTKNGGLPICDTDGGYKSDDTGERALSNANGGYRSGNTGERVMATLEREP